MPVDIREELDKLLVHSEQIWLLGAGASFDANLPLVIDLTKRVRSECGKEEIVRTGKAALVVESVISALASSLSADPTIESILDHLADHYSMARRAPKGVVLIGNGASSVEVSADELTRTRDFLVGAIRDALRWGYCYNADPALEKIGIPGNSIVDITSHDAFMEVLFARLQAGRAPRLKPVEFFTVNYDTLIEDALALRGIGCSDGFAGGALGFWDPTTFGKSANGEPSRAILTKLHGSIDWAYIPEDERIVRRRIGDLYPTKGTDVLIYPQASKYDFARREPFDTLFQRFRNALSRNTAQVLIVCGYAFGDDHVDMVIEQAMSRRSGGELTIVAFAKSRSGKLKKWCEQGFGERVYVIAEDGVWRGKDGPHLPPAGGATHDWWTFKGMTKFLADVRA
ncbi:MAG: SIR2 family protein [Aestuariivirga sp.]|nr:SIR2 family protein [Aestuariivirga sp.]